MFITRPTALKSDVGRLAAPSPEINHTFRTKNSRYRTPNASVAAVAK